MGLFRSLEYPTLPTNSSLWESPATIRQYNRKRTTRQGHKFSFWVSGVSVSRPIPKMKITQAKPEFDKINKSINIRYTIYIEFWRLESAKILRIPNTKQGGTEVKGTNFDQ